jgi:putative alpha-1,2-mannosidase
LGKNMGLSVIEVYPSANQYKQPVEWVDPYIETNRGRFFLFITGQRPYGLVSAAPMTINWNNSGGGYAHKSKEILGFPQIHAWTLSGLNLMPTLASIDPRKGEDAWRSPFKHDDEIVQIGYHRVYLPKINVWVEQTLTDRVSFYKFRWTKNTEAQLLLSLGGLIGNSRMTNPQIKKTSDSEFEDSVSSVDRAYNVGPKDIKIYFVVQVNKKWKSLDGWDGEKMLKDIALMDGGDGDTNFIMGNLGYNYKYKAKKGEPFTLYTSDYDGNNNEDLVLS